MLAQTTRQHYQHGFYYLVLAVVCLGYGQLLGRFAWLGIYPAISCLLVALAYLNNHSGFLHKTNGSHSWFSMILYGPYLLGSWCTWVFYKRRIPAWTEIIPGILMGRRLDKRETSALFKKGDIAILDLAPEILETNMLTGFAYRHIPIIDLAPPSKEQLAEAVNFIQSHYQKTRIYIHCSLGLSRSAVVVAAFLISQGLSTNRAVCLIRRLRPEIIVRAAMMEVLKAYESNLLDEDYVCRVNWQPAEKTDLTNDRAIS
jgi:protein-tyrosine phosphatase